MGIEDDILMRLQQGATPSQLVANGFRKSTVYKVAEALRSLRAPAPLSLIRDPLHRTALAISRGEIAQLTFVVTNNSGVDLYVFQVGVRPEWLNASEWIPSVLRKLLGAGDSLRYDSPCPSPRTWTLGKRTLCRNPRPVGRATVGVAVHRDDVDPRCYRLRSAPSYRRISVHYTLGFGHVLGFAP